MAPTVRAFAPADAAAVLDLVLAIQQREYGLPVTRADQPDLCDVPAHYQRGAGGFWVAEAGGRIVGTLGLLDIGGGQGALRKMFVAADWRGAAHGVAAALLAALRGHCAGRGVQAVYLGTTEAFRAAHRFYEKQGFAPIDAAALPPAFPRMAVDTRFYAWTAGAAPSVDGPAVRPPA